MKKEIFLLLILVSIVSLLPSLVSATWADSNSTSCMNITIHVSSTTYDNYSLPINLTFQTGSPNFSDVRFYGEGCNQGGTILHSWQQNFTTNTWDNEYVQIGGRSPSQYFNISVYYDNSTSVSSVSNIFTTFPFSDNFGGTSVNQSIWTYIGGVLNSSSVSGGQLSLVGSNSGSSLISSSLAYNLAGFGEPMELEAVMSSNTTNGNGLLCMTDQASVEDCGTTGNAIKIWMSSGQFQMEDYHGGTNSVILGAFQANKFYKIDIIYYSDNVSFYVNDTYLASFSSHIPSAIMHPEISNYYPSPAGVVNVKYIFIKPLVDSEATYVLSQQGTGGGGGDTTPPTYSNVGVNNSSPSTGQYVKFYSQWSDNNATGKYIFSWNGTGASCNTWSNATATSFQAGNWTNTTEQIPSACVGKVIGYQFLGNDTSNNWNSTSIQTITVKALNTYLSAVGSNDNPAGLGSIFTITGNESASSDSDVNYTLWKDNILLNSSLDLGTLYYISAGSWSVGTYTIKFNSSVSTYYNANDTGISYSQIILPVGNTIDIYSPSNTTYSYDNQQNFTYDGIDYDSGMSTFHLIVTAKNSTSTTTLLDNSNYVNATVISNQTYLGDSTYFLNVTLVDSLGRVKQSNITFTVTSTLLIYSPVPTPTSQTTGSIVNITDNITGIGMTPNTVLFTVQTPLGISTNTTNATYSAGIWFYPYLALSGATPGTYTITYVYVKDTSNNWYSINPNVVFTYSASSSPSNIGNGNSNSQSTSTTTTTNITYQPTVSTGFSFSDLVTQFLKGLTLPISLSSVLPTSLNPGVSLIIAAGRDAGPLNMGGFILGIVFSMLIAFGLPILFGASLKDKHIFGILSVLALLIFVMIVLGVG